MLEGNNVEMRMIEKMGNGLFSCENIKEGDYVVKYIGTVTKNKHNTSNEHIISVSMESSAGKKSKTYIDGSNLRSLAKYANHLCDYNATLVEVFPHDHNVPQMWIRAHRDITMFDEIMVDYGEDMFNYINDRYGCKCTKCLGMKFKGEMIE